MVGAAAPRARADEARSPTPPLPRQVRAAARRGAARALRATGRARPRPLRRLGHDARAGARIGLRRGRGRHRRLQRSAHAREDAAARSRAARAGGGRRSDAARPRIRAAERVHARVVRARGRRRAPALPRAAPGVRARRRAPGRPRARRALRPPDDPLRPRLPACAAGRRVLVPQAPPNVHAGAGCAEVPVAVPARHAGAPPGVRGRSRREAGGCRAPRRRARRGARRSVRRCRHVAPVSGPDRLPRAASVRLRAARSRRPAGARGRRRGTRHEPCRDRGVRRRDRGGAPRESATPFDRARRSASSSTTAATSIRTSSRERACGWRIGSNGTSTDAPGAVRASTSSRS